MTRIARRPAQIDDVRRYWETNPLYSYEVDQPGTLEFFSRFDEIKRNDVERFALPFWDFNRFRGKSVLDVGCGPGWLTVQYARAGAKTSAIDLTKDKIRLHESAKDCLDNCTVRGIDAT
jgi:2-polyprenyl-3-methyl-5-hydroxy-6-metoxy-1,4-benzoquinol methylase